MLLPVPSSRVRTLADSLTLTNLTLYRVAGQWPWGRARSNLQGVDCDTTGRASNRLLCKARGAEGLCSRLKSNRQRGGFESELEQERDGALLLGLLSSTFQRFFIHPSPLAS